MELFNIVFGAIVGFQIAYAFTVLVLWETMLKYYEWGYFKEAKTKWYLKIPNAFLAIWMGYGYWAGKRLSQYNWIKKRVLLIGYILLFIVISIFAYMILSKIVLWLENLFLDELFELIVR